MGRFAKPVDLSALRHEQEIFNSRMKRGEVDRPECILSTRQVICGCGVPGCCFISVTRKEDPVKEPHYVNGQDVAMASGSFKRNKQKYDPT